MLKNIFYLLILFAFNVKGQSPVKIYGIIKNDKGTVLEGVQIRVQDTKRVTFTNNKGEYQINLTPQSYILTFSLAGYRTNNLQLQLVKGKDMNISVTLLKELNSLEQVVVTDERSREAGMQNINAKDFSNNPNASQNFEALLKQLPGVSANNELSSQYSVRGGNFDENLIYINDVEIFKPYLVRNGQQEGLSLINSDLAGNVRFSAGGFSAKYGDKLSSVLDVQYQTKDSVLSILGIGTNGVSATTFFAAKNIKGAIGFRNKQNQLILNRQPVKGSYDPRFYDLQGFINYQINKKLNLNFLGIINKNQFGLEPESRETIFGTLNEVLRLRVNYEGKEIDKYQNLVGAATLNYRISDSVSFKWINSIFFNKEQENFDILGQYIFEEVENDFTGKNFSVVRANRGIGAYQDFGRNELNAQILASDFKVFINTKKSEWEGSLRFQQDLIKDELQEFNYVDSAGFSLPNNFNNFSLINASQASNNITTNRLSGYLINTTDISSKLTFTGGLRFNYNSFTKEFLPSPRFIFTYKPDNDKDILYRFATGLYVQTPFYREMRNFDGQINQDIKSQQSLHFVLSSDYKFKGLGTNLRFTTEAYYKSLFKLVPYELENLRIRYLADQTSKGYAAGLDFAINGEFVKDLESSFRLSLMKTEEDIENDSYIQKDANGNSQTIYPGYIKRPTDQRVNFSAFFQDRLFNSPTYKVHLNLLFGSRLPTWPPGAEKRDTDFKIPAYKRLDIGFSKNILDPDNKKQVKFLDKYFESLILYAEVFNLLNINNTVSYLWINDVNNNRYAIPNYLTSRQLNFKIIAKF